MVFGLWSTAQISKLSPDMDASKIVQADSSNKVEGHKLWIHNWAGYLDTACSYSNAEGLAVTIQNGKPRGEAYFDPSGRELFRVIFWYRVINEGATPIDLIVNFPADTYSVPPSADSFLKLFLPPGKFSLENLTDYNYGATTLDSYLENNFDKPTKLQETIQPNEEHLFVIGTMVYKSRGQVKAELVLKGDELFYEVSIFPHLASTMFPCGKIELKD